MPITLTDAANIQDFNNPGFGPETVYGEGGDDLLLSNDLGGSFFLGQRGNDTLVARGPGDSMFGGKDEDSLRGRVDRVYMAGNEGNDTVIADGSDSTLYGGKGEDTLQGLGARNRISGDNGRDFILGGIQGADTLVGGNGNDTLGFFVSGSGSANNTGVTGNSLGAGLNPGGNVVYGDNIDPNTDNTAEGEGNDWIYGINNRDSLYGGIGNDSIRGRGSNSYFDGGSGNDTIDNLNYTTSSLLGITSNITEEQIPIEKSTLVGGDGDDCLLGGYGSFGNGQNSLWGGAGNDTIEGYAARDILSGGAGNDWIMTGIDPVFVVASGFATTPGFVGNNLLDGGDGNDTIKAYSLSDTMMGGAGNDSLWGTFNRALGDDGNDTIDARQVNLGTNPGRVSLIGGNGDDFFWGSTSANITNVFDGSAGNDTVQFASTGDTLIGGGEGNDWYNLSRLQTGGTTPLTIGDFSGNNVFVGAQFSGTTSISNIPLYLTSGTGVDVITGGNNNDWLVGGGGGDSLFGLDGDDTLNADGPSGLGGNASLFGGIGRDCLIGGQGRDSIYYSSSLDVGSGPDIIINFRTLQSGNPNADRIALNGAAFLPNTSTGRQLGFSEFLQLGGTTTYTDANASSFTSSTSGLIIYEYPGPGANTGTLKYDSNGRNPGGLTTLAILGPVDGQTPFLTQLDFVVI